MSKDNKDNKMFKSIEEKFLEKQRSQRKVKGGPNEPSQLKRPIEFRKYMKLAIVLTVIFAIFVILLANIFIVKENEYRVVRQFGEIKIVMRKTQ